MAAERAGAAHDEENEALENAKAACMADIPPSDEAMIKLPPTEPPPVAEKRRERPAASVHAMPSAWAHVMPSAEEWLTELGGVGPILGFRRTTLAQ